MLHVKNSSSKISTQNSFCIHLRILTDPLKLQMSFNEQLLFYYFYLGPKYKLPITFLIY